MDKKKKEAAMRAHWKMLDAAKAGADRAIAKEMRYYERQARIEAEYQERRRKFLEESEG